MKTNQQIADEAAIRDAIAGWSRAVESKDPEAVVKDYAPDAVVYDVGCPLVGRDAIKAAWKRCFPYFPEAFRSEHQDLTVDVEGDLAFAYGQHRFIPEPADHPCGKFQMRVTAAFRRIGGRWRVIHEHVSIPFQMEGNEACATDEAAAQGVHRLTPHLVCANAVKAIDFYKDAFGAKEVMRLMGEDGTLMHACLEVNGSPVMLAEECTGMGSYGPTALKGTPVTIHLVVDDADAAAQRAIAAGAKIVMPVADMFWGDRYGVIEDPFGHRWAVATPKRVVRGKELEAAAAEAVAEYKKSQTAKANGVQALA